MDSVTKFEKYVIMPIFHFEKLVNAKENPYQIGEGKKNMIDSQIRSNKSKDIVHFNVEKGFSKRDTHFLNYLKNFDEIIFNGKNIIKIAGQSLKLANSKKLCKEFWSNTKKFGNDQKLLIQFLRTKRRPDNNTMSKKIQKKIRIFEKSAKFHK